MSLSAFIRISQHDYIMETLQKGVLYMNSILHHKNVEENLQRRDDKEGLIRIEQFDWMTLKTEDKEIRFSKKGENPNINILTGRIENQNLTGNIFSMIGITPELVNQTDKLDVENTGFGDTFLVINNPVEFLKRVDVAMKEKEIRYKFGLVQYYDEETYSGDLNVFCKPKRFEPQHEFRIFADLDTREPLVLEIGSIEDISFVFGIEKFEKLRMEWRPNQVHDKPQNMLV